MSVEEAEKWFVESLARIEQSALVALHALYYFFAYKRCHDEGIVKLDYFWGATAYGWQMAYIVGLGRAYDSEPTALSLHRVVNHARRYRGMFKADRLRQRLRLTLPESPKKEAMVNTYVHYATSVTEQTFDPVIVILNDQTRIYKKRYGPLRHAYYAHLAANPTASLSDLYELTTPDEFEALLEFALQLHSALSTLFTLGTNPRLVPQDNSRARERASRDVRAIIAQRAKLSTSE